MYYGNCNAVGRNRTHDHTVTVVLETTRPDLAVNNGECMSPSYDSTAFVIRSEYSLFRFVNKPFFRCSSIRLFRDYLMHNAEIAKSIGQVRQFMRFVAHVVHVLFVRLDGR